MSEVTTEVLLSREAIVVDEQACRDAMLRRVVLITGAAGSVGRHLASRIAGMDAAEVHLLDSNADGLLRLRKKLRQRAGTGQSIQTWLCSITDKQRLDGVFEAARPDIVFHLAALKSVTALEGDPARIYETNVLGSLNVFEAAEGVAEQVVFASSHAAVSPVSLYGASKRIGELLVASINSSGPTRHCAVRLTNVIDSDGAALALFTGQIKRGVPISVTHPEVSRYFVTVSEVSGLMIQAAIMSEGGEIFVLDVGDDTRIAELAKRLSRFLEPGRDPLIEYVGLRPGEKLREAIAGEGERLVPTSHPNLLLIASSLSFSGDGLRARIRELEPSRPHADHDLFARLHFIARFDQIPTT
jgi:FlaA1/EpsC-like NDP-sugar epimerase